MFNSNECVFAGGTDLIVQVQRVDEDCSGGQQVGAATAGGRSRSVPFAKRRYQCQSDRGLPVRQTHSDNTFNLLHPSQKSGNLIMLSKGNMF